jgi:hypothetical protein
MARIPYLCVPALWYRSVVVLRLSLQPLVTNPQTERLRGRTQATLLPERRSLEARCCCYVVLSLIAIDALLFLHWLT